MNVNCIESFQQFAVGRFQQVASLKQKPSHPQCIDFLTDIRAMRHIFQAGMRLNLPYADVRILLGEKQMLRSLDSQSF